MLECPVCSFPVVDARGLAVHFRHWTITHPDYKQWKEDQRWAGKVEGEDFVRCLECGHRAATLARHLKAAHGISADEYRAKHGDVLIRPSKVTERRRAAIQKGRTTSEFYEGFKNVRCPSCGREHEVHKLSGVVPCPECKAAEEARKAAERAARPKRTSPLRGRTVPPAVRQKMSENAGRWNKGLTKDTHPSLARAAEKMQGKVSWSKGLTATEDPRLAETARKLRFYTGKDRPWDNGLAANLTLEDFKPFMDVEGRVDHRKVVEATGIAWVTVRKYIVDLGLAQTRRYIEDAAEDHTIRLDKALLEGFKLGNGKVSIGKAMSVTGHVFKVIKRECLRHGLPTFNRTIRQTLCMDAVAAALGGLLYRMEWQSRRFTNPPTGRAFRFDGYFPDVSLIVEFQGYQHYTFPSVYFTEKNEAGYLAQRERDRVKRELIEAASDLIYFEVREDEPYTDEMYLRGRLHQAGVI